jgi:P-type conjugative transfer protein TrbJ
MMRHRALRRNVVLIVCAVGASLLPGRVVAQFAVIDPSNLAQNITQVAKAIQQINNQRLQIQYQLQALRKLGGANWRDIRALVQQLDILMQQGQALAYSLANLDQQFQQTFPGWQVASSNLILPVSQRIQAQRTLGTMRATLNVLSEQARQFGSGQATLASIKAQMSNIQGTQEALELQATLDAFVAEEIGLLRRTLTAQANMQAVYNAYVVNGQAETRANYRAMVDLMSLLPPQSQRTFSLVITP